MDIMELCSININATSNNLSELIGFHGQIKSVYLVPVGLQVM
jgi:hypothetical protein